MKIQNPNPQNKILNDSVSPNSLNSFSPDFLLFLLFLLRNGETTDKEINFQELSETNKLFIGPETKKDIIINGRKEEEFAITSSQQRKKNKNFPQEKENQDTNLNNQKWALIAGFLDKINNFNNTEFPLNKRDIVYESCMTKMEKPLKNQEFIIKEKIFDQKEINKGIENNILSLENEETMQNSIESGLNEHTEVKPENDYIKLKDFLDTSRKSVNDAFNFLETKNNKKESNLNISENKLNLKNINENNKNSQTVERKDLFFYKNVYKAREAEKEEKSIKTKDIEPLKTEALDLTLEPSYREEKRVLKAKVESRPAEQVFSTFKEASEKQSIKKDHIFPEEITVKVGHEEKVPPPTNEIKDSALRHINIKDVPEFVREMVVKLHPEGKHEANLRLHPPELGELHLSVSVDKGEVKLLLTVEHPRAAEALQQHLSDLQRSLEGLGFQLTGAEINLGGGGNAFSYRQEAIPFEKITSSKPKTESEERPKVSLRNSLIDIRV